MRRRVFTLVCVLLLVQIAVSQSSDPVMTTLKQELERSFGKLKSQSTPPYFLSYQLTDNRAISVSSSFGALTSSSDQTTRLLDVNLRVGDYKLDSSHSLEGSDFAITNFGQFSAPVPIEDDPKALAVALWLETDRHYKYAVQRFEAVKTNGQLRTAEEDKSPDFSAAPAEKYAEPLAELHFDRAVWEKRVRDYGKAFVGNSDIIEGSVQATGEIETRRYVSTDGTEVRLSGPLYRLNISATIRAADGEMLPLYRNFMSFTPEGLPSDEEVKKTVTDMVAMLVKLRSAPIGEPYTGPAILSGRASAVFFHEIFGHRVEGDRLKNDDDAQTFKKKIGQRVLSPSLSVYSDPTLKKFGAEDLVGYYAFDDEGIRARRVPVVEKGIFKNFLMSRSPMEKFPESNGHGRRQQGNEVGARQSNLLIESSRPLPRATLKKMLIERIKLAKKPYGLMFDDITGGFTFTNRFMPNSFSVLPTLVYRVYPNGREELIRGLNLIGTPLIAFSKISAADDQPGVFNGVCGAESGWIPVAAVAPGILIDQIEVQRKERSQDRKPILPDPLAASDSGASQKEAR